MSRGLISVLPFQFTYLTVRDRSAANLKAAYRPTRLTPWLRNFSCSCFGGHGFEFLYRDLLSSPDFHYLPKDLWQIMGK